MAEDIYLLAETNFPPFLALLRVEYSLKHCFEVAKATYAITGDHNSGDVLLNYSIYFPVSII